MAAKPWSIDFVVPGEPLTKSNNYKWFRGKLSIPKKILRYEALVTLCAKKAMKEFRRRATKLLVKMRVKYYLGTLRRKDMPNLPKTTCDALNNVVYKDDELIVDLHITKHYDPDNPRAEVTVTALPNYPDWPQIDYKKRAEDQQKRQAARKEKKKATPKKKTKKRKTKKRKKKRKT